MTTLADLALLGAPHHDGSRLYVPNQAPSLGETVVVRLRVPASVPVHRIHARFVHDGEPGFVAAYRIDAPYVSVAHTDAAADQWWAAQIVCHNPVTHYRFALDVDGLGWVWLNAQGVDELDVPDHADFRLVAYPRPPAWAREAVVYQIFPDRFARSSAAGPIALEAPDWAHPAEWDEPIDSSEQGRSVQLYGGDLWGVIEHLDHLVALGVTVIYLTPIFPARSNHRYDASSFDHVDELLGGDEALIALVEAAHARGLRVMGDITTNHTGDAHEWFTAASRDEQAPEREYYMFGELTADGRSPYVSWLGVESLPKLNYRSKALIDRMWAGEDAVLRKWLQPPYCLDGWRVDVANMTGRHGDIDVNHDVTQHLRESFEQAAPEGLLIGEHAHDHALDATGRGWHGVMNYSAFTRPVWTWLSDPSAGATFMGAPMHVQRRGGAALARTMDRFSALIPWRSRAHSFTLVGSHDTTRLRTLVADADLVPVAGALLMTMPGIPMMTYGDEVGMVGAFGEDGRRTMPWARPNEWDEAIEAAYRELIATRCSSPALMHGGMRWVAISDEAIAFLREDVCDDALVVVARSATTVELAGLGSLAPWTLRTARGGATPSANGDSVSFSAPGYAVFIRVHVHTNLVVSQAASQSTQSAETERT